MNFMNGGLLFQIQRFCTHDGPGIRTSVFLKGCPLRCAWCHNPESQRFAARTALFRRLLCIACGACVEACPKARIGFEWAPRIRPQPVPVLPAAVLRPATPAPCRPWGRSDQLRPSWRRWRRTAIYYEETGGGLTVTGGEPLSQYRIYPCRVGRGGRQGIHTCWKPAATPRQERVLGMRDVVDLFLWDIKDTDPVRHKALTGAPLEPILRPAPTRRRRATSLRCIIVDGVNWTMAHIDALAKLCLSSSIAEASRSCLIILSGMRN